MANEVNGKAGRRKGKRRNGIQALRLRLTAILTLAALLFVLPQGVLMMRDLRGHRYDTRSYPIAYNGAANMAATETNVAVVQDGMVTVYGDNTYGQCDTADWENVCAVALGRAHTVGLTRDGALLFAGDASLGRCEPDLRGLKVIAIAAHGDATYAVLSDGTVAASGGSADIVKLLKRQRNVVCIAASEGRVVVMKRDGTLRAFTGNDD